jgi:hypothetical protein
MAQDCTDGGCTHADALAITNLISESQYLVDVGRWDDLVDQCFARETAGVVPEADFGFARWRGTQALREGYGSSLPNFTAAVHTVANMHLTIDGDSATARYYLQGWHWFKEAPAERSGDNADFLILGVMTDDFIRQDGGWRLLRRRLERQGPGPAVGRLAPWLRGLGET